MIFTPDGRPIVAFFQLDPRIGRGTWSLRPPPPITENPASLPASIGHLYLHTVSEKPKTKSDPKLLFTSSSNPDIFNPGSVGCSQLWTANFTSHVGPLQKNLYYQLSVSYAPLNQYGGCPSIGPYGDPYRYIQTAFFFYGS